MANEVQLPGAGLIAFWDLGDNTYKDEMDLNLVITSSLLQGNATGFLDEAPASPTAGDIYVATTNWSGVATKNWVQIYLGRTDVAPSTLPNTVKLRGGGEWVEVEAGIGLRMWDASTNNLYILTPVGWYPAMADMLVSVRDDGTILTTNTRRINFIGDGVSLNVVGDYEVEVTIPSGGTVGPNAQTGASYTLALSDANKRVTVNNASANTVTIPADASVAFPVGTVLGITQIGAGVTSITGDTGVTVNGVSAGSADIAAQWSGVTLTKLAANTWLVEGNHGGVS